MRGLWAGGTDGSWRRRGRRPAASRVLGQRVAIGMGLRRNARATTRPHEGVVGDEVVQTGPEAVGTSARAWSRRRTAVNLHRALSIL